MSKQLVSKWDICGFRVETAPIFLWFNEWKCIHVFHRGLVTLQNLDQPTWILICICICENSSQGSHADLIVANGSVGTPEVKEE